MDFISSIWEGLKGLLENVLRLYEGAFEPFIGDAAWGLSIILLTVTVRVLMIPLMVRQTKSMRTMQALQPEMKKIQEKYKADRSMMKTDPERYRKVKEKQREAQMALYQEHGANPVGGCLPLVLQMPVFFALFEVLRGGSLAPDLSDAPFFGIQSLTTTAQEIIVGGETFVFFAAFSAVALILLQVGTTFFTQKQMMARNTTAGAEQQQAQKLMLYIMPGFLGFLSFTFPIGVVLYWVTTNVWTIGQQAFIFRQMQAEEARKADDREQTKVGTAKASQAKAVAETADQSAEVVEGTRTGKSANGAKANGNGPAGAKISGNKASGNKARVKGAGGKAASQNKAGPKASSTTATSNRKTNGSKGSSGSGGTTAKPAPSGSGQRRQRGSGRTPR